MPTWLVKRTSAKSEQRGAVRLTRPRSFLSLGLAVALLFSATAPWAVRAADPPAGIHAFSELKVFERSDRPWRVPTEDWAAARKKVEKDKIWSAWLAQQRATTDAWMARHRDRIAWKAGWSHDGVSPKDGSKLEWTDKIPDEETQEFSSASDPHVPLTPKLREWWYVTFRSRHARMMIQAGQLYRLTGEKKYAEWVIAQLDFYAENFTRWKTGRDGARLFGQGLTEATGMVKFVEAARLVLPEVGKEKLERWRTRLLDPEARLFQRQNQRIHNIALWQRSAAAQIALLVGDEELWQAALGGPFGFRRLIAEGITDDFLWCEQSFGYNEYVIHAASSLFVFAGLQGRGGELENEMVRVQNLMLAPIFLRFPNGRLPNVADVIGRVNALDQDLFASVYRVLPTTVGLAAASSSRDWDTLIDPPAKTGHATIPPVTSHSFEDTRFALLKSGAWQVFFHYGQLTKSHSQSEALNFSAYYRNIDITHDTGVVGYGSPLYKGYYIQGLNHNVPLVETEGQIPPQRGELESFSTEPARVVASQPDYRPDARARRELSIDADVLTDRVTIESTDGRKRALGLAFHVQGKVSLPESFTPDMNFAEGRSSAAKYWKNVRSAVFQDRVSFDVDYSGTLMRVTFATPGKFKVWHGTTPDAPPRQRESFYLETVGREAVFVTTIAPMPPER